MRLLALFSIVGLVSTACLGASPSSFQGRHFRGEGDAEYLQLLETARRFFEPDPELQSLAMLYTPKWNGLVEGPRWEMWWIQNSYGTTYAALPFFEEPYLSFLQNAQDLWFARMGDGKTVKFKFGNHPETIVPDGQLCDAAGPGVAIHKQGDGRVEIHDWGMEFTAAGIVMQAELLLISRDAAAIGKYLPMLERCANFIETRRDAKNNLFLAGPAGNLLAPSYAGWKRPNGTYDKAYLAGLSITYIAALDRLIELEKLAGRAAPAGVYAQRRELARQGLGQLVTSEGYFVKSIDPDGTKHGVYGAGKHGYFETSPNHDAICFNVVDDAQSQRIYQKIAAIPQLRPHQFIITNFPSLDDMYEDKGIFGFGTWVNGGHWSTCEARMILAYYRLGQQAEAAKSMKTLLGFARAFRMDNPLTDFGREVWFKNDPIHLCYDNFGPPAAFVRGLFEYQYTAQGLILKPRIPQGITRLEQHFPVRLGGKRIYLATSGSGKVASVAVNGEPWKQFTAETVTLDAGAVPDVAIVQIVLGDGKASPFAPEQRIDVAAVPGAEEPVWRPEWPVITANALPLRIGADSSGGSRFAGDLRRARIFGRAMSAAEVAMLAKGEPSALDKDAKLVADWRFDRQEGGAVPNLAGAGLAAKVVGEAAILDGDGGKVLRLSGKGYLEVADDDRLDFARELTLEAWIRPADLPANGMRIFDKSHVGMSDGYLLDTYPNSSLRLIVEHGTLVQAAKLAAGRWCHVAATVDAQGRKAIYLDGQPIAGNGGGVQQELAGLRARVERIAALHRRLAEAKLEKGYEAAHARLALAQVAATNQRLRMLKEKKLSPLPGAANLAAERSYYETVLRLCEGLEKTIGSYEKSADPRQKGVFEMWGKP